MTNEELVNEIQKGNKDLIYLLWKQNQGMIHTIVKKYKKYAEVEDLQQVAFIGFMEAIDTYDLKKGAFITWLPYYVKSEIQQYLFKNTTVKVPEYLQALCNKYNKFLASFYQKNGFAPSESDIITALEINQKQLLEIQKTIKALDTVPLDTPIAEDLTIADTIPSSEDLEKNIIDTAYGEELKQIWNYVKELDHNVSQVIVKLYKENKSPTVICGELDLTQSQVQNAKNKGLLSLARNQKLLNLIQDYDGIYVTAYYGSLNGFRITQTSNVERIVIKKLKLQEKIQKYF